MIQFDEQIFQMGWFNHQPDRLSVPRKLPKKSIVFSGKCSSLRTLQFQTMSKDFWGVKPPLKQRKMIELHIATGLCSGRWWWWFSWILLWYTSRRERFVFPACQMLAVPKKIEQMFPSIQEGVVLKPKWLNPKFNWPRCLLTIQVTQSQWQWKMSLSKFKRSTKSAQVTALCCEACFSPRCRFAPKTPQEIPLGSDPFRGLFFVVGKWLRSDVLFPS